MGIYFGWRRTGDYWFASYTWLEEELSEFSFLRMESLDRMKGAWWSSEYEYANLEQPPNERESPQIGLGCPKEIHLGGPKRFFFARCSTRGSQVS